MSNVEGMDSVYFKKTERSETLLRNYAVRYSLLCGSLFNPGAVLCLLFSVFCSLFSDLCLLTSGLSQPGTLNPEPLNLYFNI